VVLDPALFIGLLLLDCVRFVGTPKRYFFEVIAEFTESEIEQAKLREFSSAEGQVRRSA
jgi:hypothetical protein